jgi:hypothetical protein
VQDVHAASVVSIALLADCPATPQPGPHHHGHGHPDDTALFLDPQLVGLALPARASPPRREGTLVKPKRATMACTGQPWASNVTMRLTVSAAVRRRSNTVPAGWTWKRAKRSMAGAPFSLQVSFITLKGRAAPDPLRA